MRIFIHLLLVLVCGCQTNKNVPLLKLKNTHVNFVSATDTEALYRYQNYQSSDSSETILSFQLQNNTDKKVLFIYEENTLHPIIDISKSAYGTINFVVKDAEGAIVPFSKPLVQFTDVKLFDETFLVKDSIKKAYYKKVGVDSRNVEYVENFIKNSFVLYPGETKTFKYIISLPIITPIDTNLGISPIFYKGLNSNYSFQLIYNCNSEELKAKLPQYLLDELDQNGVMIFDGILQSEAIPLQLRN